MLRVYHSNRLDVLEAQSAYVATTVTFTPTTTPGSPVENTGNKRGHGSAGLTGIKRGQSC